MNSWVFLGQFSVISGHLKIENATISSHYGLSVFEETFSRDITWSSWRHRVRKALFSKCFPSTQKRIAGVLKFLRSEERLRKAPFSWRISGNGEPKAAFSNSSSLKSVYEKLRFRDGLVGTVSLTVEEKAAFSNSSSLKSVYEKLRFRDGLVGTVGLTVEIKLRFQIPPVWRAFTKSSVFVTD